MRGAGGWTGERGSGGAAERGAEEGGEEFTRGGHGGGILAVVQGLVGNGRE